VRWTQPSCDDCWTLHASRAAPRRLAEAHREAEMCCWCGELTRSGIYVRVDPTTVPFPTTADGVPL